MLKEFREFALKGSVLDLAVGIIIGAAFGKIVTSFVNDIIMPPIGMLLGGVNFTDLFWALDGNTYESLAKAQEAGAPTINYGLFINNILDFIIVAFVIFLIIRAFNRMRTKPAPVAAPIAKDCPFCKTSIPVQASRCPNCTSQL